MRKIVSLKKIDEILPIEGADRIVIAKIGGWNVIVKKDEFVVDETIVYFEVDSVLPIAVPQFSFLSNRGVKTVVKDTNIEVEAHVLKTMKMRGVFSQGLVLPVSDFDLSEKASQDEVDSYFTELGVFKFEPVLPIGSAGVVGQFPSNARKTDSERIQNLSDEFLQNLNKDEWVSTEKIDGTSSTFVKKNGKLIVASRNWEVSLTDSIQGKVAEQFNLAELMPEGSVIQGEIFGEGIQKNPLKMQGVHLRVFYGTSPESDKDFEDFVRKNFAPTLDLTLPDSVEEGVEQVFKMKSLVNPAVYAEGVVWWHKEGKIFPELGDRPNFKAINNHYLLKNDG